MCGIAGFYSSLNTFSKEDLIRMTSCLSHRGPDAEGFFFEDGIGLGHRRLSILDLSSLSNQPFVSSCGRYVIVYNGEIYNFKELANDLDFPMRTTGDTEVLVEGFAKFGTQFIHRLNGMFAFAILDQQEKELYVFRDRMGIKPLYYHWSGESFAFASETKALLALNIDRSIDKTALKDYFFLEYIPGNKSIFKSIHKLENGSYLKITPREGLSKNKYYDLQDKYNPVSFYNKNTLLEKFQMELSKAIEYQSISDVPLGAFLSGGTDSSLICSVFQAQNANPINSFTIGFDVKEFDESIYAQKVAEHLKTNHRLQIIREENAMAFLGSLVEYYDEPFAAPSAIPSLLVCKNAKEHVKVVMSGDGGDELFMGYGYYHWYNRVKMIDQIGGAKARKLISFLLSCLSNNTYRRASRLFDFEDYQNMWLHIWSQEQYMFSENEVGLLMNEPYIHQTMLDGWDRINRTSMHPFEKISLFDLKNYLPNNLLYKMDIASMAYGLEVRVPYLDHNLVEFALNIPLDFKIKRGEQKYLMKKMLEQYLPKDLIYRKKWGFPAPIGSWLKGDFGYLIDIYLNKDLLVRQDLFNHLFIQKLINEFKAGKDFHYKRLWALLFFQMWYKRYIDPTL